MNKFTATTPENFAEQFPGTCRPFAVWYNPDPNVNNLKWAVNGEDGEAVEEFEDMITALKTAAEMGKEWADESTLHAEPTGTPGEVSFSARQTRVEISGPGEVSQPI